VSRSVFAVSRYSLGESWRPLICHCGTAHKIRAVRSTPNDNSGQECEKEVAGAELAWAEDKVSWLGAS
jgi:hypothetical protein